MKINKIFLMAGLAVMGLMATSCSDDDNDYTPGKPAGGNNVVFINETNQTLALTATEFTVELRRDSSAMGSEQTVPLEIIECASVLTCPTSATFASGSAVTSITVGVSGDAKPYEEYILRARIPEDYTNPYKVQSGSPQLNMIVMKEDYKPFATAAFTSWFFEETWPINIEYSEYLDMYRIKDLYIEESGCNYYYKLGKANEDGLIPMTMCNADGTKMTKLASGYVHKTYGMVSTTWLSSNFTGYDPEDDAYYIPFQWTVSAGSFGSGYESFVINK